MSKDIKAVYKTCDDVISKDIEGICMLVPVVSGVGNLDAEVFQLNETGSRVWACLDGKTPLDHIINRLCREYDAPASAIEADVVRLVEALVEQDFIHQVA